MQRAGAAENEAQGGGFFPALSYREFRWLWYGSMASSMARWTLFLGSNWLAYDISESSLAVGMVSFASSGAYLLSPFGGWLSDRYDRRTTLQASRLAAFLGAVGLSAITFLGFIEVWQLVLVSFLGGFTRATEQPAEQALLPNTVPSSALLNAVTLNSAAFSGARLIGPIAGAPLLATVGGGGVFALAAAAYLVAGVTVHQVHIRSTGDVAAFRTIFTNLRDAAGYVSHTPEVLMVFALVALHCALTMAFDSLLPEFTIQALNGGQLEYNELLVGVGAGALFGTLGIAMVRNPRARGALVLIGGVGSGIFPFLMGLSRDVVSSSVAAVGIGATQGIFMAITATLLQSVVPDRMRGRVMSLYVMLTAGLMALMNLSNGFLADRVGAPVLFAVPGLVFAAIVIAWSLAQRELRNVYRTGELGRQTPAVIGVS